MNDHTRLIRNLIVVTSQRAWDLFCNQVRKSPESDPLTVFRYIVREAILSFPDSVYVNNPKVLFSGGPPKEALDTWAAEVGLEGDRVWFELTPYNDRLLFDLRGFPESTKEMLQSPIQVAYPECMYKPLTWLPFTTALAFDGQQSMNLKDLYR